MRGALSTLLSTCFQVLVKGTSPLQCTIEDTEIWKEVDGYVLGTFFIGVGLVTHRLLDKPQPTYDPFDSCTE
jgi:hypothetical protein